MELIFSGFGGQGVLTAGLIAAYAGNETGKKVLWSPSYGSEMRGGTANCSVTISSEDIGSPSLYQCDALVAMNEPSLDKFKNTVRKGASIIANESIIPIGYRYPQEINIFRVNATEISAAIGQNRGANLVMLGALCRATGLFSLECMIAQTENYFAEKGRSNPLNGECIKAGFNMVKSG